MMSDMILIKFFVMVKHYMSEMQLGNNSTAADFTFSTNATCFSDDKRNKCTYHHNHTET